MKGSYAKRKLNKLWKWLCNRPYEIKRFFVKRSIKSKNFSVISNNCWAGRLYQYLDMPYLSPTAGLYFFAPDYIKFVSDLRRYLNTPLRFIKPEESKYYDELKKRNQTEKPIGILDDVEIVFLHYKSKDEAEEKWNRRKKRVDFDNIFLKFSRANLCTDKEIEEFCNLQFKNKFVFNTKKVPEYPCEIFWEGCIKNDEVVFDTIPFPGPIKLKRLLNKSATTYKSTIKSEENYG